MPNETIQKFGYPDRVIAEYTHWIVLLRGVQNTAGCLILACNEEATAMPEVSPAAWAEFPRVTADLEGTLRDAFAFDRINYLLLMMVDRHVHFHVLPRYSQPQQFEGADFVDAGWPRAPALGESTQLTAEQLDKLRDHLKQRWPRT